MTIDPTEIREGMTVFSADGEKLGKVLSRSGRDVFTVEKGVFFTHDYVARFDDVAEVIGAEIRLRMTKNTFVRLRDVGAQDRAYDTIRSGSADYGFVPGTVDTMDSRGLAGRSTLRMEGEGEGVPRGSPELTEEERLQRQAAAERPVFDDAGAMPRIPPPDDT